MDQNQFLVQVGKNISKYRREAGLTQAELASKINVGVPFISRVERGEKSMKLYTFYKLAKALGVSPDMLMCSESTATQIGYVVHSIQDMSPAYLPGIREIFRSVQRILFALADDPPQETGEGDASHEP